MNGAFYIGAVGLEAQQRALEVIANNIANINTTGFKRASLNFSELVAPQEKTDISRHDPVAGLSGVSLDAARHVWTQGDLKPTGQQLDLAIEGQGFLELLGADGRSLLWRGGTLKVNDDGALAASDGTPLRASITVPQDATSLSIARDGTVSALSSDHTAAQVLGQIELVMARDPDALSDVSNGCYQAADESSLYAAKPGEDGAGTLVQGSLEGANVRLTDEMTNLLLTQRAFGANAQIVQAADQIMAIVNGLRR